MRSIKPRRPYADLDDFEKARVVERLIRNSMDFAHASRDTTREHGTPPAYHLELRRSLNKERYILGETLWTGRR